MKKIIIAALAAVSVLLAAPAANPTVIKPTVVKCLVLQTPYGIKYQEVAAPYGAAEVKISVDKVRAMANATTWKISINYSASSCTEVLAAVTATNTRAIARVEAKVQKNSSKITANSRAIAKLQKCCKKRKKVVRRHYKKNKKRRTHKKRSYARVKKHPKKKFVPLAYMPEVQFGPVDKAAVGFVTNLPQAVATGYAGHQIRRGMENRRPDNINVSATGGSATANSSSHSSASNSNTTTVNSGGDTGGGGRPPGDTGGNDDTGGGGRPGGNTGGQD